MKKILVLGGVAGIILTVSSFKKETEKLTKEKLGELLFFDPILSENRSISCASCHKPEFAFADTTVFSKGVHGRMGKRNVPSVMNMSSREAFFWDGRSATLEDQVLVPIQDGHEMNLSVNAAVYRLNKSRKYRSYFYEVFKQSPDKKNLSAAIAAFERTLETSDTPNDRWLNDEPNGMNEQQIRGRDIFREKAKCFDCHFTPDFTGDEFRSIGLFNGKDHNDSGRYQVTKDPADLGKFKVPGLRNVAVTAPYMHDGHLKTLREVIDYYDNPHAFIPDAINRDSLLLQPLNLSEQEKQDLEAFLNALTDDRFTKNTKQ